MNVPLGFKDPGTPESKMLEEQFREILGPNAQALALYLAYQSYTFLGKILTITRIYDKDPHSRHHHGAAFDIRAHNDYYTNAEQLGLIALANKWFPCGPYSTLVFHGEGFNYHGHCQTPVFNLAP